jgi:virginiamycin B lyase
MLTVPHSRVTDKPLRRALLGVVTPIAVLWLISGVARATETVPLSPELVQEIAPGRYAESLTIGPEDGIWFSEFGDGFQRVTENGVPTGEFPVKFGQELGFAEQSGSVWDPTVGSDGAIWFIEDGYSFEDPQLLGRMTTTGKTSEFEVVGNDARISSLAAGPSGVIWFAVDQEGGYVERMNAERSVEAFAVPSGDGPNVPKESEPGQLIAGPDGNMWFIDDGVDSLGHNLVGRVTPGGEVKEYPLPEGTFGSQWMASGPGGAVWIATERGVMYRVQPDGSITNFNMPRIDGTITGLGVGPEGDLWYGNGSVLGRMTASGEVTLFQPSGVSADWQGSGVLGTGGRLWFAANPGLVAIRPPLAPLSESAPAIAGEAVEGHALTAIDGEWLNVAPARAYQWLLCDSVGAACEPLLGQTGRSLVLLPAFVAQTLRVSVTAGGNGGHDTALSSPSAVVQAAPINTTTANGGTLGIKTEVPPTLATTMTWKFGWSPVGTRVRSLKLHSLPSESEVEVRCHGRRCPFRERRLRPLSPTLLQKCKAGPCLSAHGGEVELAALWHGLRLKAGVVLEIAVVHSGYVGKLFPYVIRRDGPPRPPAIRCLAPGSSEHIQTC